jgi:RNA polymerase sigma-70 factor (ECF subfamily)
LAPFRTSTRLAAALFGASSKECAAASDHREGGVADRVRLFFEELREPLYRYLQTSGAAPPDAEDIVQETLIRLYRQLHQGSQITDIRPWVFHVAHNLLVDQKRRLQRAVSLKAVLQSQMGPGEQEDPGPNPEERMVRRQRFDQLQDSIDNLTELQRQCLSLRAEGLRYREIASVLDLSMSTVADAVRRAVTNLRRRVE